MIPFRHFVRKFLPHAARHFVRELLPHAAWRGIEWLFEQIAWAGMATVLYGTVQKLRSHLDISGIVAVFLISLVILLSTRRSHRSSKSDTGSSVLQPTVASQIDKLRIGLVLKAGTGYSHAFAEKFSSELRSRFHQVNLARYQAVQDEDGSSFQAQMREAVEDKQDILVVLAPPIHGGVSGLIIDAMHLEIPVICIDQSPDPDDFHKEGLIPPATISCNNQRGGALAAQELALHLPSGSSVALITGPALSEPSNDRRSGFIYAALQCGLRINWILETNWDLSKEDAAFKKHFHAQMPDAIFCCNDRLAIQARESTEHKVPLIIGFDGLHEAQTLVNCGTILATVDQHIDLQASLAVAEIDYIAKGKEKYLKRHRTTILVEPSLVRRPNFKLAIQP